MINHIEGRLLEKNPAFAILDCNGIGYFVNISLHTYSRLGNTEKCRLLTHVITSQQDYSQSMYGFIDEQERSVFRHLLSVSGVGASTARMVLSSLSPEEVQSAIAKGEVHTFKSIKGIGEKTAQRIIVDLNGKIAPSSPKNIFSGKYNKSHEEALLALLALGFAKNNSEKALHKALSANPELPVEQLIKEALKNL